jgi:hypothetical protein
VTGWKELSGQSDVRFPAMTQIIHQLSRLGRIEAARCQIPKDLGVGMARVYQPSGKIYIRRQDLMNHS